MVASAIVRRGIWSLIWSQKVYLMPSLACLKHTQYIGGRYDMASCNIKVYRKRNICVEPTCRILYKFTCQVKKTSNNCPKVHDFLHIYYFIVYEWKRIQTKTNFLNLKLNCDEAGWEKFLEICIQFLLLLDFSLYIQIVKLNIIIIWKWNEKFIAMKGTQSEKMILPWRIYTSKQ